MSEQGVGAETKPIPLHKWTHDGDKVLLVKCVNADGTSYSGFRWPESGPVESPNWSREATCESGGLFGWPWGVGIGGGKDPEYGGRWIVFSADPADVVDLGDKAKANPAEVIYYGDWWGALSRITSGKIAWIEQNASGSAAATGERGSAAATGERGSAAATGDRGSAAATGWSGSAAATGWRGSAAATGDSGSAAATGEKSIAVVTGDLGTIEVACDGIAAVWSETVTWIVHRGAVLVQRWRTSRGQVKTAILDSRKMRLKDGAALVCRGRIKVKPAIRGEPHA